MAASPERPERREPLEEEREKARSGAAEGTQLPAERGLGGGAGETPVADVHGDRPAGEDEKDAIPDHPSLGTPPRRDRSRPVFRDSQLEDGEDYEESSLRG